MINPHRDLCLPVYFITSKAIDGVVIHDCRRLPVCLHAGRSHKLKAASDQVFADRSGERRFACLRLNSLYTSVDEPATQANQHQARWNRGASLYIMTQLNSF